MKRIIIISLLRWRGTNKSTTFAYVFIKAKIVKIEIVPLSWEVLNEYKNIYQNLELAVMIKVIR